MNSDIISSGVSKVKEEEEEEEESRGSSGSFPLVVSKSSVQEKEDFEKEEKGENAGGLMMGGSKTLEAAWSSFPMIREAVDGILEAHDKECNGEGWLPPSIYKKTFRKASSILSSSVQTTKSLTTKTKDNLPKLLQNGLQSGVYLADNLGAKSLTIVAEKVPFVGEPGSVAKAKALNTGRKISENVTSFVAETWIGQKTLGAIDSTLTLTEKPLAFIGNVDLNSKKTDESILMSPCRKSMRLKVEEKPSHYKLDVYTMGLHGKLVATARYVLKKIRRTRRNVRSTKRAGLQVLIRKEKLNTRKKLTPKKRILDISSVGTFGFVANLLQVNSLLKLFGLQIIPSADVKHTRHIIFPNNSKLYPHNLHKSLIDMDETPERASLQRISGKRSRKRQSSEDDSDNDYVDNRVTWNNDNGLSDHQNIDDELSENELANTSLDSLDSLEYIANEATDEPNANPESELVTTQKLDVSKQLSNDDNSINVSHTSESQGNNDSNTESQ